MDTKKPSINSEIERALAQLEKLSPGSEEYDELLKHVERLHEIRRKNRVSPDAVAGALTNLAGILAVLNYEKLNVISSKAFMFIRRST